MRGREPRVTFRRGHGLVVPLLRWRILGREDAGEIVSGIIIRIIIIMLMLLSPSSGLRKGVLVSARGLASMHRSLLPGVPALTLDSGVKLLKLVLLAFGGGAVLCCPVHCAGSSRSSLPSSRQSCLRTLQMSPRGQNGSYVGAAALERWIWST